VATSVSVRKHGRLTVRIDQDGHALVVRALGDLDIAGAPALEDSLRHVLESGAPSIVLDLTGVTFIDPTGQRVLQWAAENSREDGDRLRIDARSGAVRQMLKLPQDEQRLMLAIDAWNREDLDTFVDEPDLEC
jgi:anti-anti-sigma factor